MSNPLAKITNENNLGAIFMMLSMAGFVLNDTLMKIAFLELPLFQSIVIRGVFACFFMTLICWKLNGFSMPEGATKTLGHPAFVIRALGECGGTFFFLSALAHMPIANITAVLQVLPLTITLSAALFLGETVGWKRYIAIIIGFIGVMLIVKPGTEGFNIYAIYALIATLFITLRDLATRKLPKTTPSVLVSLVTAVLVTLMGLVGAFYEPWRAVSSFTYLILAGAAAILMVGYICSVLAMRYGEVSFVAPFRYSILIWALLLGIFVFGEMPDGLAIIGAIIVVGSGLFTFYRERLLARKSAIS